MRPPATAGDYHPYFLIVLLAFSDCCSDHPTRLEPQSISCPLFLLGIYSRTLRRNLLYLGVLFVVTLHYVICYFVSALHLPRAPCEPEICVCPLRPVFVLALLMLTYFIFFLSSFPFAISIWTSFVSTCLFLAGT